MPWPEAQRANYYYWGWWPDYNAPSDYSWILFNRGAIPSPDCPCYNSGYYKNATVDKIINDGFSQTDDAKLIAELKQAYAIKQNTRDSELEKADLAVELANLALLAWENGEVVSKRQTLALA